MEASKETTVVVKKNDMVTVYATDKSTHMKAGTPYEVHSVLAKKLIEKGVASKTAPKAKEAKEK